MRLRRLLIALLTIALTAGLASACTVSDKKNDAKAGSGSIKTIDSLKGTSIKVGSKEFDEQLLLGQIAILALQAAGAKAVDKTNITGTDNVRKALTTGQIDLYWEYTGTAYVSFLKQTKIVPDPQALFEAVKTADAKNNITWWGRSPANDTFAIAANSAAAKKFDVKTLSDYAAVAKKNPADASLCLDSEFKSRDDGLAGVEKAYGFTLPGSQQHVVDVAVTYPTTGKGDTCNFGVVATTDGRVPANHLVVLDDDKHFFPVYNPCISIRSSVAKKYPGLEQVFNSIAQKLTTEELLTLNKKVSVDGQKASAVAKDWMSSEGFIS